MGEYPVSESVERPVHERTTDVVFAVDVIEVICTYGFDYETIESTFSLLITEMSIELTA